jgi:hypothetical protein
MCLIFATDSKITTLETQLFAWYLRLHTRVNNGFERESVPNFTATLSDCQDSPTLSANRSLCEEAAYGMALSVLYQLGAGYRLENAKEVSATPWGK